MENKELSLQGSNIEYFANDYQQTLSASEWTTYWDGMFILKEITQVTYQQ